MNIDEKVLIANLLEQKGFKLQESSPINLRFERDNEDGFCEVQILINENSLPVSITKNGEKVTKNKTSFDELKNYLEEQFG